MSPADQTVPFIPPSVIVRQVALDAVLARQPRTRRSGWQARSIDPGGCRLGIGDKIRRLSFKTSLSRPEEVRKTLISLAEAARDVA